MHIEWRYVDANRAPVRPHGKLNTPILSVVVGGLASAQLVCRKESAMVKSNAVSIVR